MKILRLKKVHAGSKGGSKRVLILFGMVLRWILSGGAGGFWEYLAVVRCVLDHNETDAVDMWYTFRG